MRRTFPVRFGLFVLLLVTPCLLVPAQSLSGHTSKGPSKPTSFPEVESLVRQGDLDAARAKLLEDLQRTPASAEGYNLLGIIESQQRDFTGALTAFQKALQLSPSLVQTHVNIGNIYVIQKKDDLAEKEFRTALRLDPRNQNASYNLGVLLMARGSFARAIPYLEGIHPANTATRFQLIHAYLQTKRTSDALSMANELSAKNENDVQVHFSLGTLLVSESQFKPAQAELLKADALQPDTFEILYSLGVAFLRGLDYPRADLTLLRALKLKPDSAETLYWLGKSNSDQSRYLDALDYLVRARKLAPDNPDILLLMAQISMAHNYYEDAIPLLEAGTKLAPTRSDLRSALGESYFMAGKEDRAIAEFKDLIAADPSARAYALLGISYKNLGRFDEAASNFEQGLKLDPRNTECIFNLGFIAERHGDIAMAESKFQQALRINPDYPEALLELANLRVGANRLSEGEDLLKRYVHVSRSPATGYYKLAMVERSLHETAASNRDLAVFQSLSKDAAPAPHYYEHLFDYLDNRAQLAPGAREQLDMQDITEQIKRYPDRPEALYLLIEAYLKSGKIEEARNAIAQLDKISSGDYRTLTGVGVLLARYRLYDEAIQHFQAALAVNPGSDEEQFDLADAYFRKGLYVQALDAAQQVTEAGRKDDAYLALVADIEAHLGKTTQAEEIYRAAIVRNPDNDQDYLSLALLEFRQSNVDGAKQILNQGKKRIPGSGKILWGLGVASVLDGKTAEAGEQFERAVEMLPEWAGSYSTLGVFYFETGQIDKAREVLDRFKSTRTNGGLDIGRIEQVLTQSPGAAAEPNAPMTPATRKQLLQLALTLADRTL
jgi:tetratricopeptide (TPR) repeat protein